MSVVYLFKSGDPVKHDRWGLAVVTKCEGNFTFIRTKDDALRMAATSNLQRV